MEQALAHVCCSAEEGKTKVQRYCRKIYELGYVPICPQYSFSPFLDDGDAEDMQAMRRMSHQIAALADRQVKSNIYAEMGKRLNFRSARSDRDRKNMEVAAKRWIKKKHPTFDGDVYVENIRCFLDISQEELEKRKCTVNEQDTTALIFSQKHLEALYLQCLMHRRNAMQEVLELKGLSETCNRIYKLQDVDVLFQCLLMDQMDWEEGKLYVQFSTVYLLLSLRNK